ncbi:MAG: hypothetical protein ACXVQV_04590 [Actinomycetota bacterium]
MRFRFGMLLGFGIGYVLGAKAGRYRYDQIMKVSGRIWGSAPVDRAREQAGKLFDEALDRFRGESASDQLPARSVTLP